MGKATRLECLFLIGATIDRPRGSRGTPFEGDQVGPVPILLVASSVFYGMFEIKVFLRVAVGAAGTVPTTRARVTPPIGTAPGLFVRVWFLFPVLLVEGRT